jgi:probable F420-dependent oxidoreductase
MRGPHLRPFRFAVQCSSPPAGDGASSPAASWAETARRCEALGYDLLTVADHFDDQLAPIPAIMAAADATTTLRVGSMVLGNDYRHPVVLAKEAATIDLLSGGRFELGLGAGWMANDYAQAGLSFDEPRVRIDRLAESIQVLKQLFGDGPCEFSGAHYDVHGLDGTPKPVQRPRPPLLVGGGGRRVLELAAREADIVGLSTVMASGVIDAATVADGTADMTDRKVEWIRDAAGPRWDVLEMQVRVHLVVVDDNREQTAAALASGFGLTVAQALATPHALCGSPAQIVETLLERRERWGISCIGVAIDALDSLAPVVQELAGT